VISLRIRCFYLAAVVAVALACQGQTSSPAVPPTSRDAAPAKSAAQAPSASPGAGQEATPGSSTPQEAQAPQSAASPEKSQPAQPDKSASAQREQAEQELKAQKKQRILGVVPNFNTSNVQNAAPLTAGQKFRLAMRSAIDPFEFVASGLDAGLSQAENEFKGYGQGAQGYFKRFGASYADQFDGLFWGNAVLPSLLHEDPRYFRKGTGSIKRRLLYALSTTVITKNDNGTWGPNYANLLGNLIAGGISNAYYPASDRGAGLTFERAATVTAFGAAGAVFVEFWPDISRKLFHKKNPQPETPAPDVTAPASK
jgi:hypothetical protein